MKERSILFNTEMVQALLSGKKTQTRRVVNFKKLAKKTGCRRGNLVYSELLDNWAILDSNLDIDLVEYDCPYGKVGDELWVRETFKQYPPPDQNQVLYKADVINHREISKWKPSIFMPRNLSRIQLLITSVTVQKIQEMTVNEMRKEGAVPASVIYEPQVFYMWIKPWNSINEKRGYGWDKNPDVWVIEFEVKK